ncbi:A/G-specific adenine glycosylase [Mechercharimyces sp. CAU 1602]|nr:A/G-specific adenine glycosylase [Mechercharimyces sp. CAU 1602]MCS1352032.1 A/G-specific adenine glycosylase [Mechercharimyces sp. CAU 1602]
MSSAEEITAEVSEGIQQDLLTWYDTAKRDLPWRQNQDPYRIWVSEIMLQQTRVDTVIPYFENFLSQFPTLEALASASDGEVVKAWEGLGYYSRVRNLHTAVKEVMAEYGGVVPQELPAISKLKGVGPYTAGAILSIAYNKSIPAVDGNVMRVFTRLFALYDDIAKVSTRKKIEQLVAQVIPSERAGDFNQAVMELGAMICTPSSPQCLLCPVQAYCRGFAHNVERDLPVKKKAKPPVHVSVVMVWLTRGDQILIEKRPDTGLLAGMWGLPTIERQEGEVAEATLARALSEWGLEAVISGVKGQFEHVFSHRRWMSTVVAATPQVEQSYPSRWMWVTKERLLEYAYPKVYQKAFQVMGINRK